MSKEREKRQEFVKNLRANGQHWKNAVCQIRPLSLVAVACNIGLLGIVVDRVQQVSGASFPSPGLTPRAGAMTVFEVENRFRTPFSFTAIITDTRGFYYQGSPQTINPCTVEQYHLRDMPGVPSPFEGAMTLNSYDAPDQFKSAISRYDYPGQSPDPLARLGAFVFLSNGSSVVDVRNIQEQVDRLNLTVCDDLYSERADVINKQGNSDRDGEHSLSDLTITADEWNKTVPSPVQVAGAINKSALPASLSVGTSANISLEVPINPISVQDTFTVGVKLSNARRVRAYQLGLEFDPNALEFVGNTIGNEVGAIAGGNITTYQNEKPKYEKLKYEKPMIKSVFVRGTDGAFLNAGMVTLGPVVEGGSVVFGMYSQGGVSEINGDKILEVATFRAKKDGDFVINPVDPKISQRLGVQQPVQLADGSVVRIVPNQPEPTVTATPVATPGPTQTPGPYKNYMPVAGKKAN